MKNIIGLISFVLIFSNCLETDVNYVLPFEQQNVAFGFIDSVNGVRVYVGKNIPVLSKDSTGALVGVKVELWAGQNLVETLKHYEKNVFINSKNFKLLPNSNYYFKASTPLSKDSLISEKIAIPTPVSIQKVRYQYVNQQKSKMNIYVDITDPIGFNAYNLNIQRFKKDTLFGETITENPLFIPINGYFLNDREFEGRKHTFVIENINAEEYQNKRFIVMDKIRVTLFNLSKPTYDTFLSFKTPEPGIGDPFFEPTTITNQIKNGFGIFGSYSSFNYDLKL